MRRWETSNANGGTILLVEENDCLRLLLREYLEANGFEVKDAVAASEALWLAGIWGRNRPEMLIIDADIRDESGCRLADLLRKRHRADMAVIYLVKGELDMETLDGMDRHIQKPFSFLQLHSSIDESFAAAERDMLAPKPAPWRLELVGGETGLGVERSLS
jgi:DNA-binding response OmpR family regulator